MGCAADQVKDSSNLEKQKQKPLPSKKEKQNQKKKTPPGELEHSSWSDPGPSRAQSLLCWQKQGVPGSGSRVHGTVRGGQNRWSKDVSQILAWGVRGLGYQGNPLKHYPLLHTLKLPRLKDICKRQLPNETCSSRLVLIATCSFAVAIDSQELPVYVKAAPIGFLM